MAVNTLVYDGDCPLCRRYVDLLRLRDSVGEVELVSARSQHPVVRVLVAEGYDLNEGIVFVEQERVYFGAACMSRLALLSSPIGFFNRVNRTVFRSPRICAALYPVLKSGRRVLLWLLGRRQIAR